MSMRKLMWERILDDIESDSPFVMVVTITFGITLLVGGLTGIMAFNMWAFGISDGAAVLLTLAECVIAGVVWYLIHIYRDIRNEFMERFKL